MSSGPVGLNKVTLIGHVKESPTLTYTEGGMPVGIIKVWIVDRKREEKDYGETMEALVIIAYDRLGEEWTERVDSNEGYVSYPNL